MEAIYDDIGPWDDTAPGKHIAPKLGFMAFAPVVPARGSMFTAAHRSKQGENLEPVISEQDLYGK